MCKEQGICFGSISECLRSFVSQESPGILFLGAPSIFPVGNAVGTCNQIECVAFLPDSYHRSSLYGGFSHLLQGGLSVREAHSWNCARLSERYSVLLKWQHVVRKLDVILLSSQRLDVQAVFVCAFLGGGDASKTYYTDVALTSYVTLTSQ